MTATRPQAPITLSPFATAPTWRRLESPICINGKKVSKYESVVVTEWVVLETGEILPDHEAAKRPSYRRPLHLSERQLQREFVLGGLRPEVRPFARFVLKFRNRRRGITPEINTLCKWYAKLTGKQSCHVRRYIPALEGAKILAGRSLVGCLWQLPGLSLTADEHAQEDPRAEALFCKMQTENRAVFAAPAKPHWWPQDRTLTDTQADLKATPEPLAIGA